MAGAICGTCGDSSNSGPAPNCDRADCPSISLTLLMPSSAPFLRELDKHEQRDADIRKMVQMRDEMQQRLKAEKVVPWEIIKKRELE